MYINRSRYPVSEMCRFFRVSHNGYYDYVKKLDQPTRDTELVNVIRDQQENVIRLMGTAVCGDGRNVRRRYIKISKPFCVL